MLHADSIVYDSIITLHSFPTGCVINAIDYLQHGWQEGISAPLYSKVFAFQGTRVCVHAHMGTHEYPGQWQLDKPEVGEYKTDDTVKIFSQCLLSKIYFLKLPRK